MPETAQDCKGISNPAKILRGYMQVTGITDAKVLSETLGIALRTIQRLKLEACSAVEDTHAKSANDAIYGAKEAPKTPMTPDMAPPMTPDMAFSSPVPSRAHATKESPTEISVTKIDKIEDMSETDVSDHTYEDTPKARRRFSYTYDFEQFWKAYPVIGNSSKVEAYKEWRKLDSGERSNAQDGLRHLAEHCRKNPTYTCLHACRYLSQRRWESYQTVAERLGAEVVQIASYKPMPQPRRELSQAELEAMVLADEAMEAARG